MFYTISLKPTLDLILETESIQFGQENKVDRHRYDFSGEGISVSRILNKMNQRSIATGFLGGFTGQYIVDQLNEEGIENFFILHESPTSISVDVQTADGLTTYKSLGFELSEEAIQELLEYLSGHVTADDMVIISGECVQNQMDNVCQKITELCQYNQAEIILDIRPISMMDYLAYHPFLMTPTMNDLREYFDAEVESIEEIVQSAKKLQKRGARNILISHQLHEAILLTEEGKVFISQAAIVEGMSELGVRDSLLAGFAKAYAESKDLSTSLQFATAAALATSLSVDIADLAKIESFVAQISVYEWE